MHAGPDPHGTAASAEELACLLKVPPRPASIPPVAALEAGATRVPIPLNEPSRLLALQSYEIMDSGQELRYDDITLLASRICRTPMALITLINEDRQWFKSSVGLEGTETPRELAFCAHAIVRAGSECSPSPMHARRSFLRQSLRHRRSACSLLCRRAAGVRGRSCAGYPVCHRSRATTPGARAEGRPARPVAPGHGADGRTPHVGGTAWSDASADAQRGTVSRSVRERAHRHRAGLARRRMAARESILVRHAGLSGRRADAHHLPSHHASRGSGVRSALGAPDADARDSAPIRWRSAICIAPVMRCGRT